MTPATEPSPYLLSYRSENEDEDKRLDSQHISIKQAILGGHLIHPSILNSSMPTRIADVACGTGVWLEDVRLTFFEKDAMQRGEPPQLVGFDVNSHAFNPKLAPDVTLIQHDCTKDFPPEYLGKFDLVNMRGLAYAIPQESLSRLVSNVTKLLRPGGYLQWLETETRLFRQFPNTPDFTEAINMINMERDCRQLVPDMPQFMLREVLAQSSKEDDSTKDYHTNALSILKFDLLPGGICNDPERKHDPVNLRFSHIVLESVKLLLAAPLEEKRAEVQTGSDRCLATEERNTIQKHINTIAAVMESDKFIAGGYFPYLIARKSPVIPLNKMFRAKL